MNEQKTAQKKTRGRSGKSPSLYLSIFQQSSKDSLTHTFKSII